MIEDTIVGRDLGTITFPIDRSKLMELSRSFFDTDPTWHDPEAAAAQGFAEVPTPPTVTTLVDHWRAGGALETAASIGADLNRLLHGEASWELLVPVHLGDVLTTRGSITDVTRREGKRGGTMTMVTIQTEFVNQRGELAARRTDVLIETGA
ncbi:MaoC family dehydratase N-terminal domain-containing protein [Paraconexibacter antarcticus]|uniref:MaoC family dehydratase N-terminal domain-containing protein n=1 Tax=Paraconexibacter antarcticus TaxID=2949664 RepID=A0ABY5DW21_9ACTN|nr:MaoC family dehydratase N-terminal domain-containing protein [Paraconexibacter antarcticus]UTI66200.1 MaoC family dehydratase N-terminal domain-containing protein [Paraconexibacter antarcticus]